MKLMDIDADTLSIPETEYDCTRNAPSVRVRAHRACPLTARRVRAHRGLQGGRPLRRRRRGSQRLRPPPPVGKCARRHRPIRPKSEEREIEAVDEDGDDDAEEKPAVKKEKDDDVEMDKDGEDEDKDEEEFKPKDGEEDGEDEKDNDDDAEEDGDDDDDSTGKKRKKSASSSKPSKKAKTSSAKGKGKKKAADEDTAGVVIEMNQHVALTFSLKYLVNFSKSSTLSPRVQLMMSNDVPLLVRLPLFLLISLPTTNAFFRAGRIRLRPGIHPLLPRAQDRRRLNSSHSSYHPSVIYPSFVVVCVQYI